MHSRLLTTLEAEARTTNDPERWAQAVCRSAVHFGRQGHTNLALQAIDQVRSRFALNLTPSIATWLMLSEGILEFFRDNTAQAFDRTRRAHAISVAAGVSTARPTCAAWMALIQFNALQYVEMVKHLDEVLTYAGPDDHQARARGSLVLADALHFAGDFTAARPWYQATRLHATAEGDEATLSAMLHNVAAFRAGNVRVADAFGIAMPEESHRAMMEANSALHFDAAIGTASFVMLVPLVRAQVLLVEHKFAEAESTFSSLDRLNLESKSVPLLVVDLAWAKINLGKHTEAMTLFQEATSLLSSVTHIDEIAYVNARMASIARALKLQDAALAHTSSAAAALNCHKAEQAELLGRLHELHAKHKPI